MRNQTALSELALSVGSLGVLDGSFGAENSENSPNFNMQEAAQAPAKTPVQQAFLNASSANDRSFAQPKSRAASRKELAPLEDAELLRRFQGGNEDAFYVLFERRHKEIYTHCFRMCSGDGE